MEYSLSWLAIKANENKSLELLKFRKTGDFSDSILTGRSLFPDWYLIIVDDRKLYRQHKKFNFYALETQYLQKLSNDQMVITCRVDETSMY